LGIHWLRVLLGGLLAEVAVIALVIPASLLLGKQVLPFAALLGSLVACFLFAMWVGRRIDSQFMLHGILVGIIATLLYVALTLGRPEPLAYLAAHGLKVIGGAAGGFVAGRQHAPASAAATVAR